MSGEVVAPVRPLSPPASRMSSLVPAAVRATIPVRYLCESSGG